MEEFLKQLGITEEAVPAENGTYVIEIPDSNAYGRFYSKLDRSDLVEEDAESSQLTSKNSSVQYISDDYTLTLLADFDTDEYSLTIREN